MVQAKQPSDLIQRMNLKGIVVTDEDPEDLFDWRKKKS